MSEPRQSSRRILVLSLIASLGAGVSCTGDGKDKTPAVVNQAKVVSALSVTTLADGRKQAEFKITVTEPLKEIEVLWNLPEGCQASAGSMRRVVPEVLASRPASQVLIYTCAPGAPGKMRVEFHGKDAAGQPVNGSADAEP